MRTRPAELGPHDERLEAADVAACLHLCIRHLVDPGDVDDVPETSRVERVEFLDMTYVRSPRLASMQQYCEYDGLVDSYLCRQAYTALVPESLL